MKTKVCSKCKQEKLVSEFGKNSSRKDGLWHYCKSCEKIRRKQNRLRKRSLTIDDYDQLLFEQKGVCAICGKKETHCNQWGVQRLGVDHNHITNKTRGLLCVHCNTAIGSLYIDEKGIELLLKAMEYTRKYHL